MESKTNDLVRFLALAADLGVVVPRTLTLRPSLYDAIESETTERQGLKERGHVLQVAGPFGISVLERGTEETR